MMFIHFVGGCCNSLEFSENADEHSYEFCTFVLSVTESVKPSDVVRTHYSD